MSGQNRNALLTISRWFQARAPRLRNLLTTSSDARGERLRGLVDAGVIVSYAAADPVLGGGDEPDIAHAGIGGGDPDKGARRRLALTQCSSVRITDSGEATDRTSAPDVT